MSDGQEQQKIEELSVRVRALTEERNKAVAEAGRHRQANARLAALLVDRNETIVSLEKELRAKSARKAARK